MLMFMKVLEHFLRTNRNKNSRESIRVGIVNDNKTSEIVAKHVLVATGGYPTIPAIPGGTYA